MAIILKDQTPSGVPTPDTGKTAIITDAGGLYIKDDAGSVTHITSGGTVTSVGVSSANAAITVASSPVTSSGTISLTANNFTSTDPGVVSGSGGGTTNFLRADGTWAAPPGTSGTVTSVAVSGADGIGVTGSPITSSGTIALSLGAITPSSVAATGTVTGSNLSGTNTGDQTITLTGDVTGSGTGSFAATIASSAVTNAKLANMAAHTFKGNNTGSSAAPVDLTATELTAELDVFTSSLKGLTPASGGGTTNFLRADGTWAAPGAGAGTVTSVDVSGGSTGLTTTGGPVTSSGTITLGGTLAIGNGGTGQTTATAAFDALAPTTTTGDIIYHNGTDNVRLGVGSTGQVLTVAAGVPSWAAAGGGGSTYYKDAVRVATTANGTLASAFENGDTIDGVALVTGDRILLKNQSSAIENGVYTVNASGAPTRATDFDANAEVLRGVMVPVQLGTVNGGSVFQVMTSNAAPIVVGTNTIVFGPVGGIARYGLNVATAPTATASNAIAIGNGASATATGGVSIGSSTTNAGSHVVIGPSASCAATSTSYGCVVIGQSAVATASGGSQVAIGVNAASLDSSGIAIGDSTAAGANNIAIGPSAATANVNNWGTYSIAIGPSAAGGSVSSFTARGGVAIGESASTRPSATQVSAIAIGTSTNAAQNAIAIGHFATTNFNGQINLCNARFSAAGDIATGFVPAYQTTTDATPTEVGTTIGAATTTPSGRIVLTNDSSYIFDCDIIARNTATDTQSSAWNLKFAIRRGTNAASTALIGSATKTVIGQDSGTTGWDVSVTADTTNGRPKIEVTGEASKTIRWVANIRMTKVSG